MFKRIITILLILTAMLLAGCSEAWEENEDDTELHFLFFPQVNGIVQVVPIY